SSFVSAQRSGSGGRKFESSHPENKSKRLYRLLFYFLDTWNLQSVRLFHGIKANKKTNLASTRGF
ncbi:MAG: hypothetical protein IJ338_06600, partial [Bacteroidaceae bacterium]|nr:hypothetical protein [Bacteroidaceae bacterium]